jgi:outer membrane protein
VLELLTSSMFRIFLCALAVLTVAADSAHAAEPKSKARETPPVTSDFDPTVRPVAPLVQPVSPPSLAAALPRLPRRLSLRQAENYALANQPLLSASQSRAQAELERVTEARSQFFPQVSGDAVGVKAKNDDDRLAAIGGLSNPTILSRQSDGALLSQLITDFGRTYFLTTSARSNALSAAQRTQVTRETLLFRVDEAYFTAQGAQALVSVANQTVSTNQMLLDRTNALAASNLKSSLDVSFAQVSAAQAKLLQIQAEAKLQESFAELSAALGLGRKIDFTLEPQDIGGPPPADVGPLIEEALAHRPDLLAARNDRDAALRFAKAEHAASYPTITLQGGAGISPARGIPSDLTETYGAGGINVSVPVFTGGLLTARAREAAFRAQAAEKVLQDQETEAARDVYSAWFDAKTAYEAIGVSQQLVTSAQQGFQLAQSQYQTGTSSIVELSQADLQQIQAQITAATSQFDYQVRRRALDFQLGALK